MFIDSRVERCGPSLSGANDLMYRPDFRPLTARLLHVLLDEALLTVEEQESRYLSQLYTSTLSDGRLLTASSAPSLATGLLRSETIVNNAAAVLPDTPSAGRYMLEWQNDTCIRSRGAATLSSELSYEVGSHIMANVIPDSIAHDPVNWGLGCPYNIYDYIRGTPLSIYAPQLTISEHQTLGLQLDELVCELALIRSVDNMFGSVTKIDNEKSRTDAYHTHQSLGFATWRAAFRDILEGVLCDGEDMSIVLPYETIRFQCQRLAASLDSVKSAKLTLMNICHTGNVLDDRPGKASSTGMSCSTRQQEFSDGLQVPVRSVKCTGILDWSKAYFGDPLLCAAFEGRSPASIVAWNTQYEIIEGMDDIQTRLLLYRCYRAITRIVVEYFRPQHDSSQKELAGRRELTNILVALEEIR